MQPPPDSQQPKGPVGTPAGAQAGASSRSSPSPPARFAGQPVTSPPAVLSSPPTAWALLNALQRHLFLAITLGAVCAAVMAAAAWFFTPPSKLTARTLMIVPVERRFVLNAGDGTPDIPNHQRTQIALAKSRNVLQSALRDSKIAQLSLLREQIDPVDWLEKELQVDFTVAPEVIRIALSGDKPDELVKLVDAVREAYKKEVLTKSQGDRRERLDYLFRIRGDFEKLLQDLKDAQRTDPNAVGAINARAIALTQAYLQLELQATEREKLQNSAELRKAKVELELYRNSEKKVLESPPPEPIISAAIEKQEPVQKLVATVEQWQQKINAALRTVAHPDKDPGIADYRKQLAQAQASLDALRVSTRADVIRRLQEQSRDELGKNIAALQNRVALATEQQTKLDATLQDLRGKTKEAAKQDAAAEELSLYQDITKRISTEYEALKLEVEAPSRVRLLEEGVVARVNDQKRQMMIAGGAGVSTLALVLLAVAWLEFRIRRVRNADQIAQGLGMMLVGALPDSSNPSRFRRFVGLGRARHAYSHSLLTESVDSARTMLLQAAQAEFLQVVMITSAVSGEGKTSLAVHLAASLAKVGRRTLLIDGDLRNPTAHRVFDLAHAPGVCEILRGEKQLSEVTQATAIKDLWMIPAGDWNKVVAPALTNGTLDTLMGALRGQFEFIIADSSPVLPVTDPLLFGQRADAVLLSVLCNVSRMQNVYAAYQRLGAAGVRVLGTVVNGIQGETYGSAYPYLASSAGQLEMAR
jgi:succinoglycan biosynthesis transport protein ExoP